MICPHCGKEARLHRWKVQLPLPFRRQPERRPHSRPLVPRQARPKELATIIPFPSHRVSQDQEDLKRFIAHVTGMFGAVLLVDVLIVVLYSGLL